MQGCSDSRPWRARSGTVAAILALCVAHAACGPLRADPSAACCGQQRPQDQLWLVSCRSLGCDSLDQQVSRLQYWRYDCQQAWVRSALMELLATDDAGVVTILFAHGNRIDHEEAFAKGLTAYRALARSADERPIRFIVWSWPSEPLQGLVNDAREKAWRTDSVGYYMAWFLDQLKPDVPVSLWGHSYGARAITGALHLLGGGSIRGQRLARRAHPTRQPMQAVLLAAALDNDWLQNGHYHGRAMSQTAAMLLVNNGCDPLLKRYPMLYADRGHEQALGYTGLASWCVTRADWSKISQTDVCCQVGRRHTFDGYIECPDIIARMLPYLLFEPNGDLKLQGSPAPTLGGRASHPIEVAACDTVSE
jgi:hypothetical protein